MAGAREEQLVAHGRGTEYHYHLNTEIRQPADYVELISCLTFASEEDTIYIHINSPGGCLHTTIQIVNCIRQSKALVVGCSEGLVASGASIIFFACPALQVNPYSTFMIHDGSTGNIGKVNENLVSAKFNTSLISRLYHDVYYPFLTKKEIVNVLKGQDLYLDSEQVADRIEQIANSNQED